MSKKSKLDKVSETAIAIEYFREAMKQVPNGNKLIMNMLIENEKALMEQLYQKSRKECSSKEK